MYWLEVSVIVGSDAEAERVAAVLTDYGHNNVVAFEQWGDEKSLDPRALLPDQLAKIYIPEDRDSPEKRAEIVLALATRQFALPNFKVLEEEDWAEAYKQHYHPFRVGDKFWVQPSWIPGEPPEADDIMLRLDPGMAFGTGTHATTQLCLRALEQLPVKGKTLLDVGVGSGILSIAALKMGISAVYAVDVDHLAIRTTKENIALNEVDASKVTLAVGSLDAVLEKDHDIVLVNILAPIIMGMLREDALLSYGDLFVFSGIVTSQVPEMKSVIDAAGGSLQKIYQQGDWVAMVVKPQK